MGDASGSVSYIILLSSPLEGEGICVIRPSRERGEFLAGAGPKSADFRNQCAMMIMLVGHAEFTPSQDSGQALSEAEGS